MKESGLKATLAGRFFFLNIIIMTQSKRPTLQHVCTHNHTGYRSKGVTELSLSYDL